MSAGPSWTRTAHPVAVPAQPQTPDASSARAVRAFEFSPAPLRWGGSAAARPDRSSCDGRFARYAPPRRPVPQRTDHGASRTAGENSDPIPRRRKSTATYFSTCGFVCSWYLTSGLVAALSIEPDGPPACILALLVPVAVADELVGGHDPHNVHSLGVEDEPIVGAFRRVIDGSEECCVARNHVLWKASLSSGPLIIGLRARFDARQVGERRYPAQRVVGPVLVVSDEPRVGLLLYFLRAHPQKGVEDLLAEGPIEPFDEGVLHGLARLDVEPGNPVPVARVRRSGRRDGPRDDALSSTPQWLDDARPALQFSAQQILDSGVLQRELRIHPLQLRVLRLQLLQTLEVGNARARILRLAS